LHWAASLDAAIVGSLEPGAYTVQVSSGTSEGGQVLAEVYEVPEPIARLQKTKCPPHSAGAKTGENWIRRYFPGSFT
jgi:hypothetical protein